MMVFCKYADELFSSSNREESLDSFVLKVALVIFSCC
jgi:hypothetical protein